MIGFLLGLLFAYLATGGFILASILFKVKKKEGELDFGMGGFVASIACFVLWPMIVNGMLEETL